jgi:CDP-6-deoxy-D-xylo-4-hexulose-3-dehydrase
MAGLKVRLVDVNPITLNLDADDIERKITARTRAIFLVHLMGNPCEMDAVLKIAQKWNLVVLEDCCEALGAKWNGVNVGNFGVGASFSFFFSHHITTMEGGMIVCKDAELADEVRILRAHGWLRNVSQSRYDLSCYDVDPRYAFVNWGFNVRPTEIQAGFGLWQLEKLPVFNKRREALSKQFFSFLDETEYLSCPKVHQKAEPSWFALPVLVSSEAPFSRDDITTYLEGMGVETRPIVSGNISRHPVSRHVFTEFLDACLPGADAIHERGFYIGLSPMQDDSNIARLQECFHDFLARY